MPHYNKKRCQKDNAVRSSNAAINDWCRRQFQITGTVPIDKVHELADDEAKRVEGLRRLEFQREEKGFHPRSLEEAIQNANRALFGKTETEVLDFSKGSEKKTDFALRLLIDNDYADYQLPSYIRDGLIWLNKQTRGINSNSQEMRHDE